MILRSAIRRSAYYDSVALMQVQQALRNLPGIVDAGALSASKVLATSAARRCASDTPFTHFASVKLGELCPSRSATVR